MSGNSATAVGSGIGGAGGGIFNDLGAVWSVTNSTMSGNSAAGALDDINDHQRRPLQRRRHGERHQQHHQRQLSHRRFRRRRLWRRHHARNGGTLTVTNSTISDNSATGGSGFGGGIWNSQGTLNLNTSIVGNNSATSHSPDISGTAFAGYNLVENPSGATLSGMGNIIGVDPMLGPS